MRAAALFILCFGWPPAYAQDTLSVSLIFVGDIMQHESQMKAAYSSALDKYLYAPCFEFVKPILSAADLTIGNLELTLGGRPYSGYPQFSAPDELLTAIRDAGFDVLVTANNHSVDRGRAGLERTVQLLDSIGIQHTGTFRDTLEWLNDHPLVIQRNGIRLSLLNYTYGTNGIPVRAPNLVNQIDTVRIGLDLQKAATQGTDASIVFFHWGAEYVSAPSDTQKKLASFCLRNGVRIVIGSHPHVIQPMEWNRQTDQIVVYSLGNFISGQRVRYRNGGAMFHLNLRKIIHGDGTSVLSVREATYSLVWVNRASDVRRSFQVLPVSGVGIDTTIVRSRTYRTLMEEFILDARTLLQRENKGIGERRLAPRDY